MGFEYSGAGSGARLRSAVLAGLGVVALAAAPPLAAQNRPGPVQAPRRAADLRRRIEADNRYNPVASVALEEEALTLLAAEPDAKAESWFLRSLVRDLTVLARLPEAATRLEQARGQVGRTGDERDRFLLEVESASLYAAQEHHVQAKAVLEGQLPAMEAYRNRNPKDAEMGSTLGKAYRLLGSACRNLGRFPEAISAFQKGQKVFEAVADQSGQARILDQMGTLYSMLGRLDEAVALHKQAIAIAVALEDLELQATIHSSFANTYAYRQETDLQLAELKQAAELASKTQDADIQLTSIVNMADAYLRKQDYRATLRQADIALKLATQANNPGSVAVCQVNRGIALNRLGSSAEGLRLIQEGLDHFRAAQAWNDTTEITGVLAEEYAFAGDWRHAYECELLFKQLSEQQYQTENQKHIAEAGAAFENDKKQLQIDALQRDRRNQARLRLLGIAVGLLGFSTAAGLVLGRRKLQSANKALADMSLRDPLTSLANRRYLTTRITEDLAQIHRLQRLEQSDSGKARLPVNIDVVFLMIDIDHFKHVNDQHGHGAGDQVLKQFAGILSQTMRDSDTVVRWGGEEFFVVAKHTSRTDARLVAERIRSRVEAFPFDLGNGQILHKTCSIGFSSYPFFRKDPSKVAWEKVVEVADQCLYAAKAMGRNTWVGVHEAETAPLAFQDGIQTYPDVSALVGHGVLEAESFKDQPIVWTVAR